MKMRFLMAPVKFSRISSKYNTHRLHPVTGKVKGHFGTDFAASHGAPIYATADGVVSEARFKQYNGNYVKIRHDKTYETQYLHMSKIAKGMRPGSKVRQGDIIGYVGSTGLATGPHVCYRFWKNGKQVDPFKEPDAKAMLLNAAEQKEFVAKIKEIRKDLDAMAYGESKSKELTASVK
jgi:murein DD-endopeptidase MepM/ murein hydrolase activator NlpD